MFKKKEINIELPEIKAYPILTSGYGFKFIPTDKEKIIRKMATPEADATATIEYDVNSNEFYCLAQVDKHSVYQLPEITVTKEENALLQQLHKQLNSTSSITVHTF